MLNLTIIGYGNVGSTLSLLLLNSKHDIRLNIMEPDQTCEGAFLDLTHGMSLFVNKELHINDEQLFLDADFVFYTAGIPNEQGVSRLSRALENVHLAKEIFGGKNFKSKPYIIVITNPVDIVTQAIQKFSGIPAERVIGTGTFLDSLRLAYYLAKLSRFNQDAIETLVLGEHGASQVPIYSNTRINGKSIESYPEIDLNMLAEAKECTINAAYQIRQTQDGTKYGVSKCAEILLDYLLSAEEHCLALSMKTNEHYRSLLSLDHDIYLSLPVSIKDGKIEINNTLELPESELNALKESARMLSDITKNYLH